jgi:hypothetical protein
MENQTQKVLINMLDDINSRIQEYEEVYTEKDDMFMHDYSHFSYLNYLDLRAKLLQVLKEISTLYQKKCG